MQKLALLGKLLYLMPIYEPSSKYHARHTFYCIRKTLKAYITWSIKIIHNFGTVTITVKANTWEISSLEYCTLVVCIVHISHGIYTSLYSSILYTKTNNFPICTAAKYTLTKLKIKLQPRMQQFKELLHSIHFQHIYPNCYACI